MDGRTSPGGGTAGRVPLLALLLANAVSLTGNALTFVAIPWFVLETTGSAAKTGLAGGTAFLAAVLAGLFGGPLVDRLGFRRTSVLADLASCASVAAIPLLHNTVGLAFWQLLALVFLGGVLDAPGTAARQSMVPELSRTAGVGMERANSAFQGAVRLSTLVGPPIGGVLIAVLGASDVLLVDAATFAVSAAAVALFVPAGAPATEAPPGRRSGRDGGGYLAELAEGLRFVRRTRRINELYAHGHDQVTLTPLLTLNAMHAAWGTSSIYGGLAFYPGVEIRAKNGAEVPFAHREIERRGAGLNLL